MTNIVDSSPAALALIEKRKADGQAPRPNYPFEELEPGKSFTFQTSAVNWESLRTMVYKKNKLHKGAKEFVFIKHDDIGVVEVARIL